MRRGPSRVGRAATEISDRGTVLVTGATGYVGGRLVSALHARGHRIRCLARRPENLRSKVPSGVEVAGGDVLEPATLAPALAGVSTAFYLVHAMGCARDFEARDREGACNFARAARAAGVRRIVYLGALAQPGDRLSPHLRSRHDVGDLLRESGIPVIEFRASIIIGSGSLSFEMVRSLAERLPVMITPRWVSIAAQPIAIGDVLAYLCAALDVADGRSHVFEIGGSDVVSYGDLLREYARQRGLRRWMIAVPMLTPRLSSFWLALVTPLYARVGRTLIESIEHATVVRDPAARRVFPVRPRGLRDAIGDALADEDREFAERRWLDPLSASHAMPRWGGVRFGSRFVDSRVVTTDAPREAAFDVIERIGGATGWYSRADALWTVRGWIDALLGGVGMRRGRRDPRRLAVGDAVDCWRVEAIEPARRLRLVAEMKLPGRAWLEFEAEDASGGARIRQTAIFDPVGVPGLAYWYGTWPLHRWVFSEMLRGITDAAGEACATRSSPVGADRAREHARNGWMRALPLMSVLLLVGCAASARPPIRTASHVDLQRFMGDWYVIANIPTFVEKGAHNAVESYRLDEDGTIATTFSFREGSFDGERKRYEPRGFVLDTETNAVWGMQFVWPFRGDFRIVYLSEDYSQTVIGREKRDYVWIMARQPAIPDSDYRHILELLAAEGYDTARIRKVPQRWPQPAAEAASE